MNHTELARKIREAIFARSSEEGGAISKEQMDDAIERTLAAHAPKSPPSPMFCGVQPEREGIGLIHMIEPEGTRPLTYDEALTRIKTSL